MTKEEFINRLKREDIILNDRQLNQLDTYASFLKEYNEKINLTGITEYEDVLDKHFYDSLLLSFKRKMEGSLVDVGTGAGFPGVVLKIVYPKLKVVLIEPIKKRCVFLEELIKKLELEGIEILNTRGEEYSLKVREKYDYVTARAVSNLNMLIEVCGALVKQDGYFIALRGSEGNDEIAYASEAISAMGFMIDEIDEYRLSDGSKRVIGFFVKTRCTDKKFPRQYSIIKKNPL